MEGDLIIPQASTKVKHFNPLPPCGGRLSEHPSTFLAMYFNPLPPCGGRLYGPLHLWYNNSISIHSLRVEGDIKRWALTEGEDISIHSLRVEGDQANLLPMLASMISIHSLRVEGDCDNIFFCRRRKDFNPLPPCGGRLLPQYSALVVTRFQSTPSVWRETMDGSGVYQRLRFQSTPSVWRETRCFLSARSPSSISIHSLRVEGDEKIVWRCAISWTFQSTPSVWRETCHV